MRILIIGAVAAGTSAAAKARRNSEDAEIVLYEKDSYISYSGCGMPYYIGGELDNADELTPRDPAFFKSKYNIDILTQHEVLSIHPNMKTIRVKNLTNDEQFIDTYDKLIIATGARAVMPPVPGVDKSHVFTLRSINDMNRIKAFIDNNKPGTAAIIGTGFIGLEMSENLKRLGISITLIERLPQITPGLDSDMSVYVEEHLQKNDVTVFTSTTAIEITDKTIVLADGTQIDTELVIVAVGIRPNTEFAKAAGIELGIAGAIKVNERMQTNIQDIYACGDCIEHKSLITGNPIYRPLGSTANKTGRIAGDCVTGGSLSFRGILGTGIFRIFDMTVAQTGLSEREAIELGYDFIVSYNIKPDKPEYMGGKEMVIKTVADKNTGRILGVQIVGFGGVDKRIDVFVTAITFGAKAEDLFHLDLAYAPPFSTTKDPVMYSGMILDNAINKNRPLITAKELDTLTKSGEAYNIIDARVATQYEKSHIDTAHNLPHQEIRSCCDSLDKDTLTVTYCNKGVTGNATQNILLNKGFKKVYNLSGGFKQYKITHKKSDF
ncbi:MAG: dehydrogenase [Clostridiales bacterium GWF2_38_85]|nr:MAG: dehydrogenase [Clostridiales bacterium GWF2_38_85]HBL85133.1 dehydrogenase [Clostridiales bacterium]